MIYRWGQPDQQQGRRIPPESLDIAFLILIFLVSESFPEVIQHIHSFFAKGVRLCQTV